MNAIILNIVFQQKRVSTCSIEFGWVNTTSLSLAANFHVPEGINVFSLLVTPATKQLSEQQKKFAELLVYNEGRKTPTECALEAGYAEGSAHVRASELRNPNKYPLVVKYIGEIRQEVQKKYEVTFEKHNPQVG